MKIVLAAKSTYPFHPVGGVQKYVYHYAKALIAKGIEVEIVAPLDEKRRARTEKFEGIDYSFIAPSIYKYLEYPIGWLGVHLFSLSLAHYLKNRTFDLLHAFDVTAFQYLKLKNRKPVITHTFTDNFLINPIASSKLISSQNQTEKIKEKKLMMSPWVEGALRRRYFLQYYFKVKPMHFCFTQSEATFFEADIYAKEVEEVFQLNPQKNYVVPVGVDIAMIEHYRQKLSLTRKDIGFGPEHVVLMTVNRLAADKGVDKIILALAQLVKEFSHLRLLLVGQGYQEKEIYKLIEELKLKEHICHLKNVPENKLYSYYGLADLYLSAFSYPGSSISTLEAMACSLPIVTTAQPWLIKENRNGNLIEDNNPQTIAQAIRRLIVQRRLKEMGQESRRIVQAFDWENIVGEAISIYESSLKPKKAYEKV